MTKETPFSALPELPLAAWQDTLTTIHMWSQIVGKIALARTPLINHYWNATLRMTPRGFRTLPLADPSGPFAFEFDLVDHQLLIVCENGKESRLKLEAMPVKDFYAAVMDALAGLDINVKIWTMPVEFEGPIRFTEDTVHRSYDAAAVERFRHIIVWTSEVFEEFRARFVGKSSPVHFFWGSFDLAATRFNGKPAPPRPDADKVTREAYSHECISHGFWCGGGAVQEPAYYGYAAPEPPGCKTAVVSPEASYYHLDLSEFILPYEAVRKAAHPKKALLDFLQSTYEAAADLAGWDRANLERPLQ
jgi:hypothetical protein